MGEFTPRSNTATEQRRCVSVEDSHTRSWGLLGLVALLSPALSGCAPASAAAIPTPRAAVALLSPTPLELNARQGRLRLLTYNVAGLPAIVSASDPDENTSKVSPLLNGYDIVLAQEDFSYHDDLVEHAQHGYQVEPRSASFALVGDGLSTLSVYPLGDVVREEWQHCYGYLGAYSDCLGEKGFSVVRVHLSESASVDVYNVHADAGDAEGDIEARRLEFEQLTQFIQRHSRGNAVIVGGDTNLDPAKNLGDRRTLSAFLRATGLNDSCETLRCPHVEIDRVLLRGTASLELDAAAWEKDERFVDDEGVALSDHPAIGVEIHWSSAEETGTRVVSREP